MLSQSKNSIHITKIRLIFVYELLSRHYLGLKTCKKIGTSKQMKAFGSKLFTEPFPGCENAFGNDEKYFKCLAKSTVLTLSHPVGTAKMGDPNDPTTVVCPRLK